MSPSNKVNFYYGPMIKRNLYQRFISPTVSPESAAFQYLKGPTYATRAKWSGTRGTRLLFEAGFMASVADPALKAQPEIENDATKIPHIDLITNRQSVGSYAGAQDWPTR